MTHPYISVPVAVVKIVGCGHINSADACRRPHFLWIFDMLDKSLFSFSRNCTCNKRINSVHTLVEILSVGSSHNAFYIALFIIFGVAEISAFLIPGKVVKSLC